MRIRTVKPEFWTSETIASLSWDERLLFVGLWSYVEDNGVGQDNPRVILGALFSLDEDLLDALARVERGLASLARAGLITRYVVEDKPFLHVTSWEEHQRIDRVSQTRWPMPGASTIPRRTCENTKRTGSPKSTLASPSRGTRESLATHSRSEVGEGREERGEGEPPTGVVQAPRATPPKTTKGTRAPEHFELTPALTAWGRENAPLIDGQRETAQWLDHHRAKGTVAKDWTASWRTWMRRAQTYAEQRPTGRTSPGGTRTPDRIAYGDEVLQRAHSRAVNGVDLLGLTPLPTDLPTPPTGALRALPGGATA